jgi:hypothetical protein
MHVDRKTLASWMQCALSPQPLVRCQCFNYETRIDGVHSVSYCSTMASPLCAVIILYRAELINWGSTFPACVFLKILLSLLLHSSKCTNLLGKHAEITYSASHSVAFGELELAGDVLGHGRSLVKELVEWRVSFVFHHFY